jgi:uncharacterized damage-inducible protein DinB
MKTRVAVGTAVCCVVVSVAGFAAQAPAPAAGKGSELLGKGFQEVSVWVLKSAELIPADKYGYRPVATVRTVGQQIGHIVDAYNYYCKTAVAGRPVEWSDAVEKGPVDKSTALAKLKDATRMCESAYATSQAPQLMAAIAHTNLHYGNLVTYMRMLGLTPPSS